MKHVISTALAFTLIVVLFDVAPISKAPTEILMQASVFQVPAPKPTPKSVEPETSEKMTLLTLLETVVEKDRDFEKALEIIRGEQQNGNQKALLTLYEAKILARQLSFEKALQLLATADDEQLLFLKAIVFIALGNRDQAGPLLHRLADQSSDEHLRQVATSLINVYREFDRHRDGDESYLWTLFGQKLGSLGEYELARYLADRAVKRRPEYRDAWMIKGLSELKLEKIDQAELSYLSAYQLDPGNPLVQYFLGSIYRKLKKFDLSNRYLLYARENAKAYLPEILGLLAENAMDTEAFPLAAFYFERLSETASEQAAPLKKLIYLHTEKLAHPEKALVFAEKLVSLAPDDAESFTLLSFVHTKLGNFDKAKEAMDKAEALP